MGPLDLTSIRSAKELHERLASFFEFPSYYGKNWDAFDECITDFPPDGTLVIHGFQYLQIVLPRDARLLKQCLDRLTADDPSLTVRYE